MPQYIVYRHGANSANQTMTPVAPVAVVFAESADAAKRETEQYLSVYNNQHLDARLYSKCPKADRDWAFDAGILETVPCQMCGQDRELERWQVKENVICETCAGK